jgi:hypothetical protein
MAAGSTGREYADTEFAIPEQSSYLELPFHDGMLLVTTTEGPTVNFVPQLGEILKGLQLAS